METFVKRPGRSDPSPPTATVRDRDDSVRVHAHRWQRRGRPRLLMLAAPLTCHLAAAHHRLRPSSLAFRRHRDEAPATTRTHQQEEG